MIHVRNNAVLSAPLALPVAGAVVPFDTTVINTNNAHALNNNTIQTTAAGVYNALCVVTLENAGSSEVTVSLAAYADGNAIAGASISETIAAGATCEIVLPATLNIVTSASGVANVSWFVSGGAVNLTNAIAIVTRYM